MNDVDDDADDRSAVRHTFVRRRRRRQRRNLIVLRAHANDATRHEARTRAIRTQISLFTFSYSKKVEFYLWNVCPCVMLCTHSRGYNECVQLLCCCVYVWRAYAWMVCVCVCANVHCPDKRTGKFAIYHSPTRTDCNQN